MQKFIHSSLARYLIIGVLSYALEYTVFLILLHALHLEPLPANVASFLISLSFNFLLSNSWTFKAATAQNTTKLIKYILLVLVNFFLNNGLFYAINQAGVIPEITKILVTIMQTSWTYLAYRFWIFKGAKLETDPQVIM